MPRGKGLRDRRRRRRRAERRQARFGGPWPRRRHGDAGDARPILTHPHEQPRSRRTETRSPSRPSRLRRRRKLPGRVSASAIQGTNPDVTAAYIDARDAAVAAEGVYAPQHDDSHFLLVDVLARTGLAAGHRVADLCTGSGVVAIAAADQGASAVTGLVSARAPCGVPGPTRWPRASRLEVHLGSWTRAMEFRPFDVVVCNPPYVPEASGGDAEKDTDGGLDPHGPGTPDPMDAWDARIRSAPRHPICSPTTAPCCWCSPNSPGLPRP